VAAKNPFLITNVFSSGLSRTQFRRLQKEPKREAMLEWFSDNYEDPVERTPYESAEGGYQYIYGGPYDAREVVEEMFSGLASDKLIEEVIEQIEADGQTEWTRAPSADDYDEDDHPPESIRLEDIPKRPGPAYGTESDHAARRRAVHALVNLQKRLGDRPPGVGHNNPPEAH
jgi:hypothetical protein